MTELPTKLMLPFYCPTCQRVRLLEVKNFLSMSEDFFNTKQGFDATAGILGKCASCQQSGNRLVSRNEISALRTLASHPEFYSGEFLETSEEQQLILARQALEQVIGPAKTVEPTTGNPQGPYGEEMFEQGPPNPYYPGRESCGNQHTSP